MYVTTLLFVSAHCGGDAYLAHPLHEAVIRICPRVGARKALKARVLGDAAPRHIGDMDQATGTLHTEERAGGKQQP
jgi:hypothetical protein